VIKVDGGGNKHKLAYRGGVVTLEKVKKSKLLQEENTWKYPGVRGRMVNKGNRDRGEKRS